MSAVDHLAEREPVHRRGVGLVLVAALAVGLGAAMIDLPRETAALPAVAHEALRLALPGWHSAEPVSEVVYGTRGFDTFGETFLLFAAVFSVMVLTRHREPRSGFLGEEVAAKSEEDREDPPPVVPAEERRARRAEREESAESPGGEGGDAPPLPAMPDRQPLGSPGPELASAMSVVARTAIRVAAPVLAMAGIYLCALGYTPGGGFPAGAVMLGVALLAYAGFGYPRVARVLKPNLIEAVEIVFGLVIIATEVLGLVFKGTVSANWLPLAPQQTIRAGGVLQVFSGSELVEVATGLILVVFALLGLRHDWTPDLEPDEES
jgi:multicomponent Na+:H+ antiporter subunit B